MDFHTDLEQICHGSDGTENWWFCIHFLIFRPHYTYYICRCSLLLPTE